MAKSSAKCCYRKFLPFRLRWLLQQRRFGEALTFSLGSLPTALVELRRATPMYWRTRRRYTHGSGIDTVLKLPEAGCEYIGYTPDEPLRVRQLHDVTHVSLPTLLRYEDRNSMGNSGEREPATVSGLPPCRGCPRARRRLAPD